METLKVGIIGAGWMGHVHARAYQRLAQHWPDLAVRPELVAVADSSAPELLVCGVAAVSAICGNDRLEFELYINSG